MVEAFEALGLALGERAMRWRVDRDGFSVLSSPW